MSDKAAQTKYDVFVSFRGEDIRDGFLSHLIEAFHRKKIKAFVDDKLQCGDEIWPSLVGAIERSFILLIIFSEHYASSRWCLEELVKILECRKKHKRTIIPVFYHVDPTYVRHQTGSYKNALDGHEKKYHSTKVETWRDALKESANLVGIKSSYFRNDAELIEEILNLVLMRSSKHLVNSKGLIGIEKPIAHIESLLRQVSKDTRFIGIWGMGGIGKTTIAEEVFHKLCSKYDGSCFLANVRQESARHGIIILKEKLFSTLLATDVKINTTNGLPSYVKMRIGCMKVLIVLDDVNDSDQLEILVGDHDWFGPGSRIIITTRDKQVLAKEVDDIYEVGALDFDKALELFNLNAFKQNHLEMGYNMLSKRVVNYAKGIPLVLKVLGHLLRGKDKEIWESRLDKLKKMPSKKVYDVMRLSYDDLDRKEQKIFLDLACFFSGLNLKLNHIKVLLKDFENDNSMSDGLERLKDKALISISEDNFVSMHDIIQEMGWEIVRCESNEDPGRRSRLWDPDDIYEVLKNDKGTEAIRSIRMHLSTVRKLKLSPLIFAKMAKLQFLYIPSKYDQDGLDFLPERLQSMPSELKYLCWMHYPLKSLPENFSAEKLVILNLSYSGVEKLWQGVQNLVNLKEVNLFFSRFLKELPNFSKATNLEVLDVHFCGQLTSVHPSIFSLEKLEKLDLSHCTSLAELVVSNIHLSSLTYLNLKSCTSIRIFSVTSENMVELDLGSMDMNALSKQASRGQSQSKLEISHLVNYDIESLPSCFKNLTRLQYLDIRYCQELETLPELPLSLEIPLAQECRSLVTVFFPSVVEQFKENRKKVVFSNCLKLDEDSLMAIGLNAQINVMKFAHQHLSSLEHNCFEKCYNYHDSDQVVYMYPRSTVPEWLVYKTTKEYIIFDLSSGPSSPLQGFIFGFVVGKVQSYHEEMEFIITIKCAEDKVIKDSFVIYMPWPVNTIASDHVFVMYNQQCSCLLNKTAKSWTQFQIEVGLIDLPFNISLDYSIEKKVLKGFGVSPISTTTYQDFIQQNGIV